jgi:hypothetical protein
MKRHSAAWLQRHRPELVPTYPEPCAKPSRLQSVSISGRDEWGRRPENSRAKWKNGSQLELFRTKT